MPLDQWLRPHAGQPRRAAGRPAAAPAEPTLDCDAAINGLAEAIEAAAEHIHLSFYIWLDDKNGGRVADAISAAARRGVTCRVMVDALGSRDFVRGPRWRQLREAGSTCSPHWRTSPAWAASQWEGSTCATAASWLSSIVPARNDSPLVAAASRSTYPDLLACGVRLFEYPLGLLHTKSITIDGRIALVGSANMDRRSLELNFENNLLVLDPSLTAAIRARQLGYLARSTTVEAETVKAWPLRARLINDVIGMASPVL